MLPELEKDSILDQLAQRLATTAMHASVYRRGYHQHGGTIEDQKRLFYSLLHVYCKQADNPKKELFIAFNAWEQDDWTQEEVQRQLGKYLNRTRAALRTLV